ncbi:uncharacterized protein MICPUCDRAFT_53716 [Micromonas pusilla CCMP1545]|uniref:Predicted protein n=1 Tax=Micromonas pusilla (strain CCMP1545) TaxID=564608 RepID=C1N7J3_MICPC|nr:uncharacterized protein MICPUCDRAFT_53716 [Micromonas pusilla CCMP1545]EEH52116.1 predicted protein [Micromonas pusilla CCMP1545]|eukprot:XP_003063743.1 predicted protein [Micromonas pusilla CCMP1545]
MSCAVDYAIGTSRPPRRHPPARGKERRRDEEEVSRPMEARGRRVASRAPCPSE